MGGAIARTTDIFRAIERNYFQIRKTIDASFYAVAFKNVEHAQLFNGQGMLKPLKKTDQLQLAIR